MRRLEALIQRARSAEGLLVAGCLSGTSVDGVDVALARITSDEEGRLRKPLALVHFATVPFEEELRVRIVRAIEGGAFTPRAFALLDRDVARAIAGAVSDAEAACGERADLVASHGQTVGHHDGRGDAGPWTLQLGDGDVLAERLERPVASDFRAADVAGGGEGAPLVPLVDADLFPGVPRPAALLNLGGIANLTVLGTGAVTGFDVGPANAWLDGFARRLLGEAFDRDGATATAGEVDPELLALWLEHPFLHARPPKSTGRDTFGEAWIEARLAEGGERPARDLLATAAAGVAQAVAEALQRVPGPQPRLLVVAGGGWHHRRVRAELGRRSGLPVHPSDDFGVPVDAREALAFALLGLRCLLGAPSEVGPVTGARSPRVLGKLSQGPSGAALDDSSSPGA